MIASPGIATATATPQRIWRVVTILWIFIIVSPPVGALAFVFTLALVGMGMKAGLAGLTWVGLFALLCAMSLRRLMFAGPAAADDLLAGIRRTCFGMLAWPIVVAGVVAVGLGVLLLFGQPGLLPSRADTLQPEYMPVVLAICLGNALIGWAILRNWIFAAVNADKVQT
jgi:hypothetical protein